MPPEQVVALLKASAQKRRPRKWMILLFWLGVFGLPLALVVWAFWPKPSPPPMMIVAFDILGLPGEEVPLQVQVEPREEGQTEARLDGWTVTFHEVPLLPTPGQQLWQETAQTSPEGMASASWTPPPDKKMLAFVARFAPDPEQKKTPPEDRGWIYSLPSNTSLLIVDIEHSLARLKVEEWATRNILDIEPNEQAFQTLADLTRDKTYQPVYLALHVPGIKSYRMVRGWVQSRQLPEGTRLPAGPVLGRKSYQPDQAKAQWQEQLAAIKKKFTGKLAAVTSHPPTATIFKEAGLQTFLIGPAAPEQPGLMGLDDWSKLIEHLP